MTFIKKHLRTVNEEKAGEGITDEIAFKWPLKGR